MSKWEARIAGFGIAYVILFGLYQCEIEPMIHHLKNRNEQHESR